MIREDMKNLSILAVCQHFGSQRRLAKILGCTPSFIGHVVHGRRPMPEKWAPIIEQASGGRFLRSELAPNSPWVKTTEKTEDKNA